MDPSYLLRAFLSRWKGVVIILVIGIGATVYFTQQQPKIYQANADGFVSTDTSEDGALASVNDSLAKSRAPSYITIATSRSTAERAAEILGLDVDPSSLIGNITVEQPPGTVLLRILARSTSPTEAQKLADAWVRALAAQVEEIEAPGATISPIKIVPIEAAALPGAPISPNLSRNVAVGGVLSLMLGLGYAFLFFRLDRRLRMAADIEKQFRTSVMGTVPAFHGDTKQRSIVLESALDGGDGWGASEAFRRLRTNVAYMDVDNPPRVILVTSPNQAEGKSTVAMNLAAAIAASSQSVVLVDADLRRPTAASSMGLDDAVGLTGVLIGQVELTEALQHHPTYENLQVLAAGSIPPNPSELLASKAMGGVLRELALNNIVVIDAPPVLPVTDASVLSRHSDGALVVVAYGATIDAELRDTLGQLEVVQGRVLGVVLNRVPRTGGSNYYRRYYGSRKDKRGDATKAKTAARKPKGKRSR